MADEPLQWFQTKLDALGSPGATFETRNELLVELRTRLTSLGQTERARFGRDLDLGSLLDCLTSSNNDNGQEQRVGQLCEALGLFSVPDVLENGIEIQLLERHSDELVKMLEHKLDPVKCCALGLLLTASSSERGLRMLLDHPLLLERAVETLGNDALGVAQPAIRLMKRIGADSEGCRQLYAGRPLRSFARLLNTSETVRFRAYEVFVDVAKSGPQGFEATLKSGFLHDIVKQLDAEDPLLQLNVMQTLTELADDEAGLDFLEQQGAVAKLAHRIAKVQENPLGPLAIRGLMKFFGHVAKLHPREIFAKYPAVINALFDVLETQDPALLAIALDTLAHIASTKEGKYALQNLGDLTITAMKKVADTVQKARTEERVRALNNLATILHVDKSQQDNRIGSLTKSWFDCLYDEPLKTIVSICKQPFTDIRQAAFQVLAEIASQDWGQELIAGDSGLIEFLLDRNVESCKECKEAKFFVVKQLAESTINVFDANTLEKLKTFVKDGAFHVDIVTEVALEGA